MCIDGSTYCTPITNGACDEVKVADDAKLKCCPYLTIGNFEDNIYVTKKTVYPEARLKESYYYVDNVSVTTLEDSSKAKIPALVIYFLF